MNRKTITHYIRQQMRNGVSTSAKRLQIGPLCEALRGLIKAAKTARGNFRGVRKLIHRDKTAMKTGGQTS